MKYKLIQEQPKTYALVFAAGDELASGLKSFVSEQNIASAHLTAIGALNSAKLGWFSWETKQYETAVTLDEQIELLSLIGNVALRDGVPHIHAHMSVGKKDGSAHGGHLLEAYVRPTCEVILIEHSVELHRELDRESTLALIKL